MSKRILALLLVLGLLAGCGAPGYSSDAPGDQLTLIQDTPAVTAAPSTEAPPAEAPTEPSTEALPAEAETEPPAEAPTPELQRTTPAESPAPDLQEDGTYTAPEDVALYLHLYGALPSNFITKNEARDLGWDSSRGNLWDVAPGKSIGGDRFGNYEGLLPAGVKYRECDVNYAGGYRGGERLIYGDDGSIWYTGDHYNSFTQLY